MTGAVTDVHGGEASLVARLTLEQKVRLLTGADAWSTHAEPAVGLRSMLLSDGPAGIRGRKLDRGDRSSSLPCPVALAATWDDDLVRTVAGALGREAHAKGVDVLLAPTVNLVRTPLSGRGFECFSEDPLLTSGIAVAYICGLQDAGVGAAVKHYVGNDSETERRTYDAQITEVVLRELYLAPFEACVEAGVVMVMAAYNSVNGATMTANARLLRDVLKQEWGFRGVVVSDWSATWTTEASARAGLDLVMPGPNGPWGDYLVAAVRAGTVREAEVDDKVMRLLVLAHGAGALDERVAPPAGVDGELVDPALLRAAAARSFVLLRNRDAALPLDCERVQRLALIGPNAATPQTQGGGSVRVLPVVRPALREALAAALGDDITLDAQRGCLTWPTVPYPEHGSLHDPVSGEPGVRLEVHEADGTLVHDAPFPSSVVTWWDGLPDAVHRPGSQLVMRARYTPLADGPHLVGAAGVGNVVVSIDGSRVGEATTTPPREVVEAFSRPPELRVVVQMEAGKELDVVVEYRPAVAGPDGGFVSLRLGIAVDPDEDRLLDEAVSAASAAEVAVVVVGSADGTESEGYDRDTMSLPGRQDELVARVAAANANTVVVVNSGMPMLMPWADEVGAVIQAWLPGQAFGEALADCLTGVAEPGGRLPVSLPRVESDSPVLRATPNTGKLPYTEGLLVGYRGYDRNDVAPLFCFGHGLGYTEWTYQSVVLASDRLTAGSDASLVVRIHNSGSRAGREVVQVYVEPPRDDPARPVRVLAAYAVVDVEPGEYADVPLTVRARTFARFDPDARRWACSPGTYTVRIGRSSRDLRLDAHLNVQAATSD